MKDIAAQENFPPYVIGSVTDWDTWLTLNDPVGIPPCNGVELRVDALPASIGCDDILAHRIWKPVLITIRRTEEGGHRPMGEVERRKTAARLLSIASGLDWEIAAMPEAADLICQAKNAGVTVVASAHDFQRPPSLEVLLNMERAARRMGADIVKFAFRLNTVEDLQTGVELLRRRTGPLAVMGMGALGPVSRLLYAQMGSALVYGYLGERESAPGQWPAKLFQEALMHMVSCEG